MRVAHIENMPVPHPTSRTICRRVWWSTPGGKAEREREREREGGWRGGG